MPGIIVIGAAALAAASATSAPSTEELADIVRRQSALIAQLQARVDALEAKVAATPAGAAAAPPQPASRPVVATGLALAAPASDLGYVRLRGRLQADAWATSPGAGAGAEVRRARLGAEGHITPRLSFVVEADFAGGAASLQDAKVDYALSGGLSLRAGYHKIPFSMTDTVSSNYELFLEPPVGVKPFAPGRGTGGSVLDHGRHWFIQTGVFAQREHDAAEGSAKDSVTSAVRLAWAPVNESASVVHLGGSVYETHFTDQPGFRIHAKAERDMGPYLIDSGPLDLERMTAEGLEAAATHGPIGVRAEGAWAQLDQRLGRTLDDRGYAVSAWWTLTGEPRPYRIDSATFDRQVPFHPVTDGGPGALQLAVRYSRLDLDDQGLLPGKLSVGTIALNWYLTAHARMMLDLNTSRAETRSSVRTDNGLGGRVQVDW